WLLRLYPATWRKRYGDEFSALLDDCQLSLAVLFDLLGGALDAHLHQLLLTGRILPMINRTRRAEITVFCAWIAFVVAGLAFQRMSEYDDFQNAGATYPVIGVSYIAIQVGAAVALLAVLAGGLPVALSALTRALAQRRFDVLLLFGVPVLALAAILAYISIVVTIPGGVSQQTDTPTSLGKALFLGLIAVFSLAASASAWAVSAAISRSDADERWYRFARIPAIVTALAMLVMAVATIVWGLALRVNVPQLFNGNDGIIAINTGISWLVIAIVMVIATLAALAPIFFGSGERMERQAASPVRA
ncbi:MAG TPA: hypothetical protein VGP82_08430, partial [Ktedonobacterales bacterium]|nr:hypothetical protein [Ktedonobacterales bacterium]